MNKNAIKKFAIEARTRLKDSVTDKAGGLGITEELCSEPITKGADFEVYRTTAGTEVTLNKRQCEQRRKLVSQIESRGFEAVVEEVAYTWFNRICAIRFMEVNDYLPNRVRVLSSEKEGKMEPDLVTQAPDVDLDLTAQEKEEIINWKMSGTSEDTDKMFGKLFLKQCHQLHDILPGLFEADSDYMELLFGISYTNKDDVIYMLVNPETGIPEQDFNVSTLDEEGNPTGQVEIIGWLYQYYNTELKDDTFAKLKKNVKITKERIPAATQLFTPDWIVRYMVENSVGRIWIEHLRAMDPSTDEKATAERFGWKYYLPEAEQEEDVNVKLAEIHTTYKDLKPTDITCIDPCMGSGHILIAMFDVLMDIYESAGYDKREAAFEIVEHNIHGLDIDQRAYQLAYFAVMMKGRGYNRRFLRGRDGKPEPKVYAIVESNEINRNHLQFFGAHMNDTERTQSQTQLEILLNTFTDAREYGSILNVEACDWDKLEQFVEDLDTDGQISFESVGSEETQASLRKLVRVAKNLGQKYDAVVTNPPYMGMSNSGQQLVKYVKEHFPDSKTDMFSVFIEKCNNILKDNGIEAMITMQAWMFLSSYSKLRVKIINQNLLSLLQFGIKAFEEIGNDVVQTAAFVERNSRLPQYKSYFYRLLERDRLEKQQNYLQRKNCYISKTKDFEKIPGMPFAYWIKDKVKDSFENDHISDIANTVRGYATASSEKYVRKWYEVDWNNIMFNCTSNEMAYDSNKRWFPYNKGGLYRKWFGNNEEVVDYYHNGENYVQLKGFCYSNQDYYFKRSITWTKVCTGRISLRYNDYGFIFGDAGPALIARCDDELFIILGMLNSKIAEQLLEVINPTLNYTNEAVGNIPIFCKDELKDELKDNVLHCINLMKRDWNLEEKSWEFEKHFLLGKGKLENIYDGWCKKCEENYNKLLVLESRINEILAESLNIEKEIDFYLDDRDICVKRPELRKDIKSLISYAVGCMFGRYSLDENGLIYAGGKWNSNRYISLSADNDNIIPISDEMYFEDDVVSRFQDFLCIVYGKEYLEDNLQFIADAIGGSGDSREIIRKYFLNDFFKDHCSTYSALFAGSRPIYWLFDSGKQNGFKALIYMHRYDADTVGRVRTDYLHRAQKYVETAMQSAQYTIDNASSASEKSKATKAVTKYTKQLAEMKIYDEAIAHIANQRIEIDLDDGVKVNYAKFQGVEVAQEGKKALKVDLLAKLK